MKKDSAKNTYRDRKGKIMETCAKTLRAGPPPDDAMTAVLLDPKPQWHERPVSEAERKVISERTGLPVHLVCCKKARRRDCTCDVSRICNVHGPKCYGEHVEEGEEDA